MLYWVIYAQRITALHCTALSVVYHNLAAAAAADNSRAECDDSDNDNSDVWLDY